MGIAVLGGVLLAPQPCAAQGAPGFPQNGTRTSGSDTSDAIAASLRVMVSEPSGEPANFALVTLGMIAGGMVEQSTTEVGQAEFNNLQPGEYIIQVVAPGYQTFEQRVSAISLGTFVMVRLKPLAEGASSGASRPAMPVLAPKVQKLVAQALAVLRSGKPSDAQQPLEEAHRLAPNHPYVNFLYGIYFSRIHYRKEAEECWLKALNLYPRHVDSLLYLSDSMVRDNRAADAVPYLQRAIEAAPASWRAHAMMAQALLSQKKYDEAVQEADRALELGKAQAAGVQPLLASALAAQGNKERAMAVLESYLHDRPGDAAAQKMLNALRAPAPAPAPTPAKAAKPAPAAPVLTAPLLPLPWMPPDVDAKVPAVEAGVPCQLDKVLHRTGQRMKELLGSLDRFTATESLTHEYIGDDALPITTELRTYNYLVSMGVSRPGYLNVEEYRDGDPASADFPGNVATHGLPALVLLFHSSQAPNFEFTCEGLARSASGLTWLVHFRQKPDKPSTMRVYRTPGHTYPINLKGRAWIAADSFQVMRLETDLVSSLPDIRLAAEHTAVDYGPVRFPNKKVELWLPQNAEIHFDWRGQRVHRLHSFSNYVLFSVDDKQKILPPKSEATPAPASPALSARGKQQLQPQP